MGLRNQNFVTLTICFGLLQMSGITTAGHLGRETDMCFHAKCPSSGNPLQLGRISAQGHV